MGRLRIIWVGWRGEFIKRERRMHFSMRERGGVTLAGERGGRTLT